MGKDKTKTKGKAPKKDEKRPAGNARVGSSVQDLSYDKNGLDAAVAWVVSNSMIHGLDATWELLLTRTQERVREIEEALHDRRK